MDHSRRLDSEQRIALRSLNDPGHIGVGQAGRLARQRCDCLRGKRAERKLTPNPRAGCPDGPGYDQEQAVWIFSSAACGVYGMSDTKITNSGAKPPLGKIELQSIGNVNVRGGSGWLLMTVGELEQ